jgi:uncharacterized protein YbbK (DUF523 family)
MINMKLVSACLCSINCRYDGGSKPDKKLIDLARAGKAIPVCPQQLGGLKTPRPKSEIIGGTGSDVLDGNARVINLEGEDVTKEFINGAFAALKIVKINNIDEAILKAGCPSCSCGKIYNGAFHGVLIDGDGVTAALLKRNGVRVHDEKER